MYLSPAAIPELNWTVTTDPLNDAVAFPPRLDVPMSNERLSPSASENNSVNGKSNAWVPTGKDNSGWAELNSGQVLLDVVLLSVDVSVTIEEITIVFETLNSLM